jgi:exopolyphosphatase/guanosine-5'-triphosphate,3'-diphosphate pyrophosphatase
MDLAVRALAQFRRVVEVRRVDGVRAVATSAVREARNRAGFLDRVKRESGIEVDVISGYEEARLIYRAARHALGLEGGPHLLVDIGGGSVELVLVKDRRRIWMKSAKLGAARLIEHFLRDDPPTQAQCKRLESHLEIEIGAQMRAARRAGVVRAVGTSGTINLIVAMACAARGEGVERLHGATASATEVARLCRKLVRTNAAMRMALPGMDPKRVDQVTAAAMLAEFVLRHSHAAQLTACTWALREGLLLEMAQTKEDRTVRQARPASIGALAARFVRSNRHGRHVAALALQLFDATAIELRLPQSSRELLEYAALLHDIGHAIDHDRHNRHSYYLVKNAELPGFEPAEIEMLALAAGAHRKQAAQLDSPEWHNLNSAKRQIARGMAAILRVADALDRSHLGLVKTVDIVYSPGCALIEVGPAREKADLELWTCETRTDLLARLLDRRVILHQ